MIILFKYCAGVENCESFRGLGYIYIYINYMQCSKFSISTKFIYAILICISVYTNNQLIYNAPTVQKKILKLVPFLSFSCNFLSTKQKLKQRVPKYIITFQRSHQFQLTNSGTNSVLNLSNSPRPLLTPSLARPKNSPTFTLASSKQTQFPSSLTCQVSTITALSHVGLTESDSTMETHQTHLGLQKLQRKN